MTNSSSSRNIFLIVLKQFILPGFLLFTAFRASPVQNPLVSVTSFPSQGTRCNSRPHHFSSKIWNLPLNPPPCTEFYPEGLCQPGNCLPMQKSRLGFIQGPNFLSYFLGLAFLLPPLIHFCLIHP